MSTISIKRILFAGTALVAVSAFSLQSQAANVPQTATGVLTWASNGAADNSTTDGTKALAGDDLNIVTFATTVTNNGTANDGSGNANTFAIGALTNTGAIAGGPFTVTTGSANDLAVTIGSVGLAASTSQGSFTVNNTSSGNVNATVVNVTGAFSSTGNLVLTNSDTTTAKTVTTTVGGNYTSAGTSTITAGSFAGADAILTLNGGTNTFGTALDLSDTAGGTGGHATLVLGGSGAQTVAGSIAGGAANEGTLTITNTDAAGGVTFAGTVGGGGDNLYAINASVANTTTTFSSGVHATTTNITGAGTVAFGSGSNTTNVSFAGNDGVVTLAGGGTFTGNVDDSTTADKGTLTLSGATTFTGTVGATDAIKALNAGVQGTASTFSSTVSAGTVTIDGGSSTASAGSVGFGSSLTAGAGGMTVSSEGTAAAQAESATVTGTFTDTGALNVTAANTSGANAKLTLNGATNTITGATTLTDGTSGLSTLEIGNGASVTFSGGLVGNASGEGTLTLDGATSVSGVIGSTSLLAINAGASGTTTFANAVTATTLNVTGTGTVDLNGTTGANVSFAGNGTVKLGTGLTLTGNVDTPTTAGTGKFTFVDNGTVTGTLGATHALNALTVGAANTTGELATVNGDLVAGNTTSISGNTLATNGAFTLGTGQTLNATITGIGATANGKVTAVGAATVSNSAILDITVASAATTAAVAGTTYDYNFITSGSTAVGQSVIIHGGSPLWTFTQVGNTADLEIAAHRNTVASIASLGGSANNAAVGAALDIAAGGSNAALTTTFANLAAAPTAAAANNILSSLTPTVNGGSQMAALEIGSQVQNITDNRMAALRADDGSTGVAAGASANDVSMWFQGYGQNATQDERDSIAGYTSTTWGGAVGVDTTRWANDSVFGFALNYGVATVDSKNVNTTSTNIDNYGLTLYNTIGLSPQTFINDQLNYAYNKIGNTRHNAGGTGIDATGNTNSDQYGAKIALGHDYVMGKTLITPDVSAAYTRLTTNGYSEKGSGPNLNVASSSQNNLDLGVGLKTAWTWQDPDGSLMKPSLHAGYDYAAIDDRIDTTSTFIGSPGATFVTTGPVPERNSFNAGASITYIASSDWDMSANYNYEYRTDYTSNAGTLRLTTHF